MAQTQITYTYVDPRYLDGDPYEVAAKACAQAQAAAKLLARAVADANVMARNAELERELSRGEEPDAAAWDESPLGRKIATVAESVAGLERNLATVRVAASYNPAKPPREA